MHPRRSDAHGYSAALCGKTEVYREPQGDLSLYAVGLHPTPQSRSGWGRGGLLGRNRPVTATRWGRARERFVAADAVVVKLRADDPGFHPLVPKRPVGVLLAVAHGQLAPTPSTTRAVALRDVRLVRVRRISSGNRSRKHKRRSTTQYRSAKASGGERHFDSLKPASLKGPSRGPSEVRFVLIKSRH
jgi:hypothetical protein